MNKLKQMALTQAQKEKKVYNFFSVALMIITMVLLFTVDSKYSIVTLLLTMLALLSANATQTKIDIYEHEEYSDLTDKYIEGKE